jgi:hypothetical protein
VRLLASSVTSFVSASITKIEALLTRVNQIVRLKGADPEIGPKLPALFRQVGLQDLHLSHVQPAFMEGEAKRIHQITLDNIAPVIAAGLVTEDDIDALGSELETFVQNSETIVSFPRIFQVWGYRK